VGGPKSPISLPFGERHLASVRAVPSQLFIYIVWTPLLSRRFGCCMPIATLLIFLSLCADVSAAAVTQFQTQTTSTGFMPLTTGFTPPPECSSLTIVHSQRYVALYQGCVGTDPTCCPQSGRLNNTYSPGVCPSGYVAHDAHVGLDRLAVDTLEWEATCIPQ